MRSIDYKTAFNELMKQNIAEVVQSINTPEMQYKIEQYALRYDLPVLFIKHRILTDNVFAMTFAKDPSKQSYNQKVALDFIKQNPIVQNCRQLPASGENALYIFDGQLCTKHNLPPNTGIKSIDFYWEIIGSKQTLLRFYASHNTTIYALFLKMLLAQKSPTHFFLQLLTVHTIPAKIAFKK